MLRVRLPSKFDLYFASIHFQKVELSLIQAVAIHLLAPVVTVSGATRFTGASEASMRQLLAVYPLNLVLHNSDHRFRQKLLDKLKTASRRP